MKDLVAAFSLGLGSGVSGCLLTCLPLLAGYLMAGERGRRAKWLLALRFAFWKALPYLALGALAGWFGQEFSDLWSAPRLGRSLRIASGLLVLLIGVLMLLGRADPHPLCRFGHRALIGSHDRGLMLVALLAGFSPCLPFLGLLPHIALMALGPWRGLLLAAAFALGATLPLLAITLGIGTLRFSGRGPKIAAAIRLAASIIVIVWGVVLIL